MSGEWIGPKDEPHRCRLPVIHSHTTGDRWRCECGLIYVVESVSQHGESWKQFRRET